MTTAGQPQKSTSFERFLFGFTRAMVLLVSALAVVGIALLMLGLVRLSKNDTHISLSDLFPSAQSAPAISGSVTTPSAPEDVQLPSIVSGYLADPAGYLQTVKDELPDREDQKEYISNLASVLTEAEERYPVPISEVDANLPADKAGMKIGDIIVAVNGAPGGYRTFGSFVGAGKEFKVEVERDGKRQLLSMTPMSFTENDGTTHGRVGIKGGGKIKETLKLYARAKKAKLEKSDVEKYKAIGVKASFVVAAFGLAIFAALMSLILVVLAVERNTRPAVG